MSKETAMQACPEELSEEESRAISELFRKYREEHSKEGYEDAGEWMFRMLGIVHYDWRGGKLTDRQFSYMVDEIMCW